MALSFASLGEGANLTALEGLEAPISRMNRKHMTMTLDEVLQALNRQGAWPISLEHACQIINALEGEASGGKEICIEAKIKARHGNDPALVSCIAGDCTVHQVQFRNLYRLYSLSGGLDDE